MPTEGRQVGEHRVRKRVHHLWPADKGPDGHPPTEGFGQHHDVWYDVPVLAGKPLARPAKARLDLIKDH